MWVYVPDDFVIAATCNPALCAKALLPTYGCLLLGIILANSSAKWDTLVSSSNCLSVMISKPSFNLRFAITEIIFALPVLSPQPFKQAWTCVAPLSTAIIVFATAISASLCTWIPISPRFKFITFSVICLISIGIVPPFVSHKTIASAPASDAAFTVDKA